MNKKGKKGNKKKDNLTGKQEDRLIKVVSFFFVFALCLTIFNVFYNSWILNGIFETVGKTIMILFYGFKTAVSHISGPAALYLPELDGQEISIGQGSTFVLSLTTFLSKRLKGFIVTFIEYILRA